MEIRRRLNVLMASRHAIYGGQLMPILQVTRAIVGGWGQAVPHNWGVHVKVLHHVHKQLMKSCLIKMGTEPPWVAEGAILRVIPLGSYEDVKTFCPNLERNF